MCEGTTSVALGVEVYKIYLLLNKTKADVMAYKSLLAVLNWLSHKSKNNINSR